MLNIKKKGGNRSKLININLEFDVKILKTGMMENEKKSKVGGLFATNTSANNFSCNQQTDTHFSTYPQAAAPTDSSDSDHYSADDEDSVAGFSFGNNKPTSLAFAAAKPTKTSHLFSQPRRPRLVEESFGWSTPQTAPFNQVDYKLYDNRLASFANE